MLRLGSGVRRNGVTDFELLSEEDRIKVRQAVRDWLAAGDPERLEHDKVVDRLVQNHGDNVEGLKRALGKLEAQLPDLAERAEQAKREATRDTVLAAAVAAGAGAGILFFPQTALALSLGAVAGTAGVFGLDLGLTLLLDIDSGPAFLQDVVRDVAVGTTNKKVAILGKAPDFALQGAMKTTERMALLATSAFELLNLGLAWSTSADHEEALNSLESGVERIRDAIECLEDPSGECEEAVRRNISTTVSGLFNFVDGDAVPIRSGHALVDGVVDEAVEYVVQLVRDSLPNVTSAGSEAQREGAAQATWMARERTSAPGVGAFRQVQSEQRTPLGEINERLGKLPAAFGTLTVERVDGLELHDGFRLHYDTRREVLGAMAAVAATIDVSSGPPEEGGSVAYDVVRFKADARVEQPGLYEGAIEYGFDRERAYEAAGGVVRVKDLFDLEVFFIAPSANGFVAVFALGLGNSLPVTIPVGATGFALKRVRGHFAHNYTATLPLKDTENLSAEQVAEWINTNDADPFGAWRRASEERGYVGGFGLGGDFVTLPDSGFLVTLEGVGFGYFSEGPVVYLHGSGRLLDTGSLDIEATALILPSDGRIALSALASLEVPSQEPRGDSFKILSARGGVDAQASLHDPRAWYLHLGTRERPIRGTLLQDLLTAETYFMVDHTAIATGGRVHAGRAMWLGPFGVAGQFGMAIDTRLGFNPIQIETGVEVLGSLSACFWNWCLGLGLGAQISTTLVTPTFLEVRGHVSLRLPFRRRSVSASGVILRYDTLGEEDAVPEVVAPLQIVDPAAITNASPAESKIKAPEEDAEGQRTVLGAFHHLTGKQWQLAPSASEAIWPDAELVVPFVERVGSRVQQDGDHDPEQVCIINPQADDALESGGYEVTHRLTRLQVHEVDDRGERRPKCGMHAGWAQIDGEPGGATHRLHLPMRTPFDWMSPYASLRDLAGPPVDHSMVCGFGTGDAVVVTSATRQGRLRVLPSDPGHGFGPVRLEPRNHEPPSGDLGLSHTESRGLAELLQGDGATRALIAARGDGEVEVRLEFVDDGGAPIQVAEALVVTTSSRRLEPHRDPEAHIIRSDGARSPLDVAAEPRGVELPEGAGGFAATYRVAPRTAGGFDRLALSLFPRVDVDVEVAAVILRPFTPEPLGGQEAEPWYPGLYELSISGTTTVSGHELQVHEHSWDHVQRFEVVPVPSLRPYIFDTTHGDSRLFRGERDEWNPTPFGTGFPAYRDDLGVVRMRSARVDHFATFTAPSEGGEEAVITVEVDGRKVDSAFRQTREWPEPVAVREWIKGQNRSQGSDTGGRDLRPPQEFVFDPASRDLPAGSIASSTLTILRTSQDAAGENTKLDEWRMTFSRYDSIEEHLRLPNTLTAVDTAYSHRGPGVYRPASTLSVETDDGPSLTVPQEGSVDAAAVDAFLDRDDRPEHALGRDGVPAGWLIDDDLGDIALGPDGAGTLGRWAHLAFMHAAHWAGIRMRTGAPMDGLLEPPAETELAYVKTPWDEDRPLMLWLRTPEPLDWRRIQASIVMAPLREASEDRPGVFGEATPERLTFDDVCLLPSPDGASALLCLSAAGGTGTPALVHWPQGLYRLTLKYALVEEDVRRLPWLHHREGSGLDERSDLRKRDVPLRFLVHVGRPWPGVDGASRVVGGERA